MSYIITLNIAEDCISIFFVSYPISNTVPSIYQVIKPYPISNTVPSIYQVIKPSFRILNSFDKSL